MSLTFEQRYEEIVREIDKRKNQWTLNSMAFEDARQIILIHVYKKYHLFEESKVIDGRKVEFTHWVNSLITHKIYGIWRDNLAIFSRPCVGNPRDGMERCAFNAGGDLCTATKSGKQCSECKLYKDWETRKKDHHAVKQTLTLENHSQEVSNIQSDFTDIEEKKRVIDEKMKERLDKQEWKAYKMLIVDGKTERQAAQALGFKKKRGKKSRMYPGYLKILALRHKFVELAKEIIENEDLA